MRALFIQVFLLCLHVRHTIAYHTSGCALHKFYSIFVGIPGIRSFTCIPLMARLTVLVASCVVLNVA